MTQRLFVEKRESFRVEASSLLKDFNENLSLNLRSLRLVNVYDLFGFSEDLVEKSRYSVFGEKATDLVTDTLPLEGSKYLAVEYLPGQFDQRASSAVDCVHLIEPGADIRIKSARLIIFDGSVSDETIERIAAYFINPVECRRKDLSVIQESEQASGFLRFCQIRSGIVPDESCTGFAMPSQGQEAYWVILVTSTGADAETAALRRIARELLRRVTEEARAFGCGAVQITASDMGVLLYTDFGFRKNPNFMQLSLQEDPS